MIFTRDLVTRKNHWQITSLVTKNSLFTVTDALFFIYVICKMAAILSRPHCVFVFVFVFDELYLYLIRFLPVYLYLYLYLKLRKKNYLYMYLYLYLIKRI